jgi:hypothetical protein
MKEQKDEKLVCSNCECEVQLDDDFCPDCGSLFAENINCTEHQNEYAEGVCVICLQPYCGECGAYINNIFLCNDDNDYEIYEGMARIFGSNDASQVDFMKNCLEQAELHPYVYSRKASPIYQVSETNDLNLITELKLMVPLQEVIKAEEIIDELNISKE